MTETLSDLLSTVANRMRLVEGQAVRLLVEMEELPAGICGVVRLAENNGNETDGVEFEAGCISMRRLLNGQIERVIDYVEPVGAVDLDAELKEITDWLADNPPVPVPELPEQMQMVSGFLTGLVWAIEDRTPLDKLSDDQREILARVSQMMEQDLGTKNAE